MNVLLHDLLHQRTSFMFQSSNHYTPYYSVSMCVCVCVDMWVIIIISYSVYIMLEGIHTTPDYVSVIMYDCIYVTISRKRDHLSHITKFHIYLPADSAQHAL